MLLGVVEKLLGCLEVGLCVILLVNVVEGLCCGYREWEVSVVGVDWQEVELEI